MNKVTLLKGDCFQKLKELEDNSVDSVVTDPPYGIGFMNKEWDSPKKHKELIEREQKRSEERYKEGKSPAKGGFTKGVQPGLPIGGAKEGKWFEEWSEQWAKEAYRVLKPGGYLVSFCAPRMYHRMASGIEDAGFEIRDQIMWVFGSGFPKSHNIGKAVDKIGGNSIGWFGEWLKEWRQQNNIPQSKIAKLFPSKTGGLTGCVSNWELGKNIPTLEEYNKIVEEFDLPFKSLEELEREVIGKKNSACFGKEERHTIGSSKSVEVEITKGNSPYEGWGTALKPAHEPIVMARKPFKGNVANNVLEWGVGGINVDGCRVGNEVRTTPIHSTDVKEDNTLFGLHPTIQHHREETTLGRFPANIIFDEEAGKILDEQSGISKSVKRKNESNTISKPNIDFGGGIKNENNEYNDLGGASRFFYCPKASKKDRESGNVHPTVKPTDLMAYLIRLITPKGGLVLDPFMGSGSTGKAAVREGMSFIGIERETEYMEIAKSRIEHEQKKNKHQDFFDI